MNCPAIIWALRQPTLNPTERVVLIYLADIARGMVCRPAQTVIARDLAISERSVWAALQRLETLGLVSVERKRKNHVRNALNVYRILRPIEPKQSHVKVAPKPPHLSDLTDRLPANFAGAHAEPQILSVVGKPVEIRDLTDRLPANFAVDSLSKKESKEEKKCRASARNTAARPPEFSTFSKIAEPTSKRAAQPAWTAIERDWWPNLDDVQFAASKGIGTADLANEVDRFVAWHRSQGKRMRDWSERWRFWITGSMGKAKRSGNTVAEAGGMMAIVEHLFGHRGNDDEETVH